MAVGTVFLTIGVLGLTAGITGRGQFLHLAFGAVGFALARTFNGSRIYLVGGGVVYLALFAFGFIAPHAQLTPVSWLHPALAIAMFALGAVLGRNPRDLGRPIR